MDKMIGIMSPGTLKGFIADVDMLGKGADRETLEMAKKAQKALNVIVGPECPECKESDLDRLVWIDDDTVRCSGCGLEFIP